MKQAYFFSHDSNAKDDPKCSMLIEQLGCEGYGIYWVLVETLRDQPDYKYPISMLPVIARKYNTTFEKVRVVVGNYGLFETDDEMFFSLSLCRRMNKMERLINQRIEAGKSSAAKRKLLPSPIKNQRAVNDRSTVAQQMKGNETKVNETKGSITETLQTKSTKNVKTKNKYGEYQNVLLTIEEYEKLKKDYGNTDSLIKFLDEYIEEKGYKSKCHNLAIRRWVVDAVSKKKNLTNNNHPEIPFDADGIRQLPFRG